MFSKIFITFLAASATSVLASPASTPTAVVSTHVATSTTKSISSSHTPTPASSCRAPSPPSGRPVCSSPPAGSFILRLGHCGNKYDGKYLNPVQNTTDNIAHVYTVSNAPSAADAFDYPPAFTFGPWAWLGGFAGGSDSTTVKGLTAPTFDGTAGDWDCYLQKDLVPFDCYTGVGTEFKYWYVQESNGEVWTATEELVAKGYERVVPYIIQGCSS